MQIRRVALGAALIAGLVATICTIPLVPRKEPAPPAAAQLRIGF